MNLGLPFAKCNFGSCFQLFQKTNLLRCGACTAVLYCGADHQRADRTAHKTSCGLIKGAIAKLKSEEAALRNHPDMTADPFETAVGHFWLIAGTRPYMRAREELMVALLNIRTGEAVQAALGHARDMLRLCRGDNQDVRFRMLALFLRLGRDQDAFDFIMWYATTGKDNYEWGDMTLPFLDLHGEDALQPYDDHTHAGHGDLAFQVAMTLIKTRLLLDVANLQKTVRRAGGMTEEEKMAWLREEALSDVLLSRPDVVRQKNYARIVKDLEDQVRKMYDVVKATNKHFWPAILHPEPYSNATPTLYTFGSPEEVIVVFRDSWYSGQRRRPPSSTLGPLFVVMSKRWLPAVRSLLFC